MSLRELPDVTFYDAYAAGRSKRPVLSVANPMAEEPSLQKLRLTPRSGRSWTRDREKSASSDIGIPQHLEKLLASRAALWANGNRRPIVLRDCLLFCLTSRIIEPV